MEIIDTDLPPPHSGPVPQAMTAEGGIFVSALFGAEAAIHTPAFGRQGEHARYMVEVTAYRG